MHIFYVYNMYMHVCLVHLCMYNVFIMYVAYVCIVSTMYILYCIASIHLYSASRSSHQSEALPVLETQRKERGLETTKRGTWPTS